MVRRDGAVTFHVRQLEEPRNTLGATGVGGVRARSAGGVAGQAPGIVSENCATGTGRVTRLVRQHVESVLALEAIELRRVHATQTTDIAGIAIVVRFLVVESRGTGLEAKAVES